jgi:hypothetical protein
MIPNGYEPCYYSRHHQVDNYWDQATAYGWTDEAETFVPASVKAEKVYSFQTTINGIVLEAEDITLGQAQELMKKFTEMGATEFVLTPEGVEE